MATESASAPQAIVPGSVEKQDIGSFPPQHLLTRAQSFDDPASYRAGLSEAFEWIAYHTVRGRRLPPSASSGRGWMT